MRNVVGSHRDVRLKTRQETQAGPTDTKTDGKGAKTKYQAAAVSAGTARAAARSGGSALDVLLDGPGLPTGVKAVTLYTTLPRGGLQACRVAGAGGNTAADTAAAWAGLTGGEATHDGGLAVRVDGPVFGGFPGVLVLSGGRWATTLAEAAAAVRQAFAAHFTVRPDVPARQLVMAGNRVASPAHPDTDFGPTLFDGLRGMAKLDTAGGRKMLPATRGTRVPASAVRIDHYPALGGGPATFVSLAPRAEDWHALRPADFAADAEMSRLALAVRFMAVEFRRGPALGDVAASVGLSPFHFHRRFSECFGLTPKHVLFDLQLDEAQRLLADPDRALNEIAETCGFAHQSHFTSRFKQGTGLTPSRWRRMVSSG